MRETTYVQNWTDEARRVSAVKVAALLRKVPGVDALKCLGCKRRIQTDGTRWRCRCGAKGDGLSLASRALTGTDWRTAEQGGRLRAWFASHGLCEGVQSREVAP